MNKSSLINYYKSLHLEMKKYGKPAGTERIDIIQKNIGKGKPILNIGCRDGTLTKYFIEEHTLIGCDIDNIALSYSEAPPTRRGFRARNNYFNLYSCLSSPLTERGIQAASS